MKIYVIGSLRNPLVPEVANILRVQKYDVFDDWFAAGCRFCEHSADESWRRYEEERDHSYSEALQGLAAEHIFNFDSKHLLTSDVGVMVLPAGRAAHLELGILAGRGKPVFILLSEQEDRWDIMYRWAIVCSSIPELLQKIKDIDEYC